MEAVNNATDNDATDLGSRIDALLARAEITELVHRVGATLDEARFDDLATVFAADATATTPGGTAHGIDAMIEQARRNHSPDAGIQHVISDVLIDFDGDAATVRANLTLTFAEVDGGSGPHRRLGQVYAFGARRVPAEGWRLTRVASRPVWTENG